MPGAPPDWFSTGDPTIGGDPPAERDAGASDSFDFGRVDTAPVEVPAAGGHLGRYVLEALLGEGAMGQVWRARDPQLDRGVAIKVVHPSIAASPDGGPRLLREARAMAKLSHPNVVAVFDAGDDAGRLFVAMDLVNGTTLGDWLRGSAPRDWRAVLARFRDAGRGLAAAHAAGVLHRDFKADNVLIDGSGRVCVADFGLAAFGAPTESTRVTARAQAAVVSDLTAAGTVMGTPAYMSPEQLRGDVIDARADQFSFCASLYEALYGHHPFLGAAPMSIVALVDAIDRGAIRAAPVDDPVPRWLRAAVIRGLAPTPAARWPSMDALLAALVPPRRVSPIIIVAAVLALVATGLAIATTVRARRPAPPPLVVTTLQRFDLAMATRIAVAPDGRRLALSTLDRIEVRSFDGQRLWSYLDPTSSLQRVVWDGPERLLYAQGVPARVTEVDVASGTVRERGRWPAWDRWLGRLDGRDVLIREVGAQATVATVDAAGVATQLAAIDGQVSVAVTAPSGRRMALMIERRYDGKIIVLDGRGEVARSGWLTALTAVAWLDENAVVYATGTVEAPTLWRTRLVGASLTPGREFYRAERGWFGQLTVGGGRLLFIDSGAAFRSRMLERDASGAAARDLDPAAVGATVGWLDDDTYLGWNRASGRVEQHGRAGPPIVTAARLDGEPIAATRAGDVLIATLRGNAGRQAVAVSLRDGRELWRLAPGIARTVRCAGDAAPPCVVAKEPTAAAPGELRWIDPTTGVVGDAVGPPRRVDEVAVRSDGAMVAISDGSRTLKELDVSTGAVAAIDVGVSARAVTYDPRGGLLVAGTERPNRYVLHQVRDGAVAVVSQSNDEILFMPRPSPSGARLLLMGRLFLPTLLELPLAAVR